jgi:hypothetical protein
MFRAMFSPIIRSTWLYLQYLVVFTQVAAGWCPEWVETAKQLVDVVRHTVPDNVHQLHVQEASTYEKPEAASAVWGSW